MARPGWAGAGGVEAIATEILAASLSPQSSQAGLWLGWNAAAARLHQKPGSGKGNHQPTVL